MSAFSLSTVGKAAQSRPSLSCGGGGGGEWVGLRRQDVANEAFSTYLCKCSKGMQDAVRDQANLVHGQDYLFRTIPVTIKYSCPRLKPDILVH